MARACISVISGYAMPRRQPRWPSIGLNSCSSWTRWAIFSAVMPIFCASSCLRGVVVRQEFVQRRIEEANRRREALERLEDADEILALIRQELGERGFAVFGVVGEDHLAHGVDAVAFEEHVLGAAEADARWRRTRRRCAVCSGLSALVRTSRRGDLARTTS